MKLFNYEKLNKDNVYVLFNHTQQKQLQDFLDWCTLIQHGFNYDAKSYFKINENKDLLFNIEKRTVSFNVPTVLDLILHYEEICMNDIEEQAEIERLTKQKQDLLDKNKELAEEINDSLLFFYSPKNDLEEWNLNINSIQKINLLLENKSRLS